MREIDQKVVNVGDDEEKIAMLIKEHELFILRSACKTARRFVSKNDDEWSIALTAFYEALKTYSYDKGSFIAFAQLLIQRNLIDYYRSQNKYNAEVQVDRIEDSAVIDHDEKNIKHEIEAIAEVLQSYGFTFMDLTDCSPKAQKTKIACAKIVSYLLKNQLIVLEMRRSKQLPLKEIEKKVKIPRKIIERHRKYIITAVEILSGDYPYLSEYLRFIKEGMQQ